jgi:hypothetical protein
MRWGALFAIAALAPAGSARAQEGVLVIDFQRAEADEELARHLSTAIRDAAQQMPAWSVTPRDPSMAEAMAAAACETLDVPCLDRIALAHDAERVIHARVIEAPPPAEGAEPAAQRAIEIHVFRASWHAEEMVLHDRVPGRARSPAEVAVRVRSWVERIAGRPLMGRIVVHAASPNAEVLIDGETVLSVQDHTVVTHDVAAGPRTVEVRIPGHYTMRRRVLVAPGQEVVVEAETAETDETETAARPDREERREPRGIAALSDERFDWLGWGLSIGGGTMLLIGLAVSLRIGGIDDEAAYVRYRARVPAGGDVCVDASNSVSHGESPAVVARVDELCGEASTLEVLQWVFFVGGLAAIGTGAYLLLSAEEPPPPADRERRRSRARDQASLQWRPIVSPDGAQLRATLRF